MNDPTIPPPGGQFPPPPPERIVYYVPANLRTGLATTTLVMGILGLVMCPLVGIAAIVTGIISLSRISREPMVYGGKGLSIAGLTCGVASLACIAPLMISILLPSLARARELSKRLVCGANLKAVGLALRTYSSDLEGEEVPTIDDLIRAGLLPENQSKCLNSDTKNFVIIRPNPSTTFGGRQVIAYEPKSNHGDEGGNVLFQDGSVMFVRKDEYDALLHSISPRSP